MTATKRWRVYHDLTALHRLLISVGTGLLAALLLPARLPWELRVLGIWDASALAFLVLAWLVLATADADETRRVSTREDDSRAASSLLLTLASLISLAGVGFGLARAQSLEQAQPALSAVLTAISILTVALSWGVTHSLFTFHYARAYHTDPEGGVDFNAGDDDPEGGQPDYRDFVYLAFTVGMTYQVSDTDISKRRIRHLITQHGLLSYLFGTVIVAVTINVVAGLLK